MTTRSIAPSTNPDTAPDTEVVSNEKTVEAMLLLFLLVGSFFFVFFQHAFYAVMVFVAVKTVLVWVMDAHDRRRERIARRVRERHQ